MFKHNKHNAVLSAALALIMLVSALTGCRGCTENSAVVPTEAPVVIDDTPAPTDGATPEPTEVPEVTVSMHENTAFIKAVASGTFGVASDGSLRFMGMAVSGQNLIANFANVVGLAANDNVIAVLQKNGTIAYSQTEEVIPFINAARWTNIADIAMGDRHFVGISTDGRVYAIGDNSQGQTAVSDWTGAMKIAAAGNYTAALTVGGVVTTLGSQFDAQFSELRVLDIAAARDHLSVLLENGTVRSFAVSGAASGTDNGQEPVNKNYDWTGIVRIFAGEGGATFAVDAAGDLHTDSALIDAPVGNVYSVSASADHAVVLHGDGTVTGFGDNSMMQINLSGWRLLPYVTDEGWLLGNAPGTVIDGEPVRTGRELTYKNPATGGTRAATCVLLGDVNGDGAIDSADVDAVNAHIDGTGSLSGAFLRAANVIMDGAAPDSIDVNDTDLIAAQAGGRNVIDQYAKTDMYTDDLAEARRLNPEACGYITIEGTNISYPIMYGDPALHGGDLWYYNDHDINGTSTSRGSIYFYWNTANGNIVVTGHNSRTSGTMFHELHLVQDNADELNEYENRLWYINAFGQSGYWEVWAMYEEPRFRREEDSSLFYNTRWNNTPFDAMTDAEKQEWIDYQLDKNELGYSVNVGVKDRFMTIVTCGDNHQDSKYGARLYFFLRWVGSN